MKEAADAFVLSEFIVEANGFLGLEDVRGDASFFQHLQGLRADLELSVNPLGEDHGFGAAQQQLFDVRRLNARDMAGAGFLPLPFTRASGKEFGVF